jgi:small subunit ribosomal protein S8e
MVIYQGRSKHLPTGRKFHPSEKKRKSRLGREPIETKIGNSRKKVVRTRGGNDKIKAFSQDTINATDLKTKKTVIAKIKRLAENKASVDYQRRAILTKGAIVETDKGKVKITSRPGQVGHLNGILME